MECRCEGLAPWGDRSSPCALVGTRCLLGEVPDSSRAASGPQSSLLRQTHLPDFYASVCPKSNAGASYNNIINKFLEWVLLRDFSETADDGHPVISHAAFRNPVPKMSRRGLPRLDGESVHSPLPYGYIDELRQMPAAGPNFADWTWAHTVSGPRIGMGGIVAPDWFPVTEDDIDHTDR